MKVKQDTRDDEPYRALAKRAAEESPGGYVAVARDAGVGANPASGRVIIRNWVEGKKDRKSKHYKPALSPENREKLLAYLRSRYLAGHPHASFLLRLERMIAWSRRHDPVNVEPLLREMEHVLADRAGEVPWDYASEKGRAIWDDRLRTMANR